MLLTVSLCASPGAMATVVAPAETEVCSCPADPLMVVYDGCAGATDCDNAYCEYLTADAFIREVPCITEKIECEEGDGDPAPPYVTSDNNECALASKFNADIDAGETPGDYDAFKKCMVAAACFFAGMPSTKSCYEALAKCQKVLVGVEFEIPIDGWYFQPPTPDEWERLSEEVNGGR